MLKKGQLTVIAIMAVTALLVAGATVGHSAEAKRGSSSSKTSEVQVYVKNVFKTKPKEIQKLQVCLASDDGCMNRFLKTVNLQNSDGKHGIQKVATFQIKFSNNPYDEFGPSDVSACGKLRHAVDCAYGNLVKSGKNGYKATIDYRELYENNRTD
jgi:hypothetical protein